MEIGGKEPKQRAAELDWNKTRLENELNTAKWSRDELIYIVKAEANQTGVQEKTDGERERAEFT